MRSRAPEINSSPLCTIIRMLKARSSFVTRLRRSPPCNFSLLWVPLSPCVSFSDFTHCITTGPEFMSNNDIRVPSGLNETDTASCELNRSNSIPVSISSTKPIISVSDPSCKSTISDLIAKQHWSLIKPLVEPIGPTKFLENLFENDYSAEAILAFFKWSQNGFRITHSTNHLCKLLVSLVHSKKYSKIRSLLNACVRISQIDSIPSFFHSLVTCSSDRCGNSVIVDILISTFMCYNKFDSALDVFKRAGDYGLFLSAISCNQLLRGLVNEGKLRVTEFVFKDMIKRRVVNLITYNIAINGFCKSGKLNKAKNVFEDMKVWGFIPNVVTYNTLIDGYCKKGGIGKMYKAESFFKEMVDNKVSPSAITYNILIDGFYKDDNASSAKRLFREMQEMKLTPSVLTYNSMINGLCCEGKIEEAEDMLDKMVGLGLKPNIVTYNTILNGFCKKKMLDKAKYLFDDIITGQKTSVNVLTFNTLIDSYCKAGRIQEAILVLESMVAKKVVPNISTYNCLLAGYYREGMIEEGNKILSEIEEKGLGGGDLITYNIRVSALTSRGQTRKAVRVLDEMSERNIIPNHVTYNTLMAGYCDEGNPTAGMTIWRRMEKDGKKPNIVSYNVLIKGLCDKGKMKEANVYLNKMMEKGLIPNRTTYDIISEQMKDNGFVPDIDGHLYTDSFNASA